MTAFLRRFSSASCRDRHDARLEVRAKPLRLLGRLPSGQALAEFALVVPIMLAIVGGIVQFGVIFWAQNTLTQVVRDTGRWEASQQTSPCSLQTGADAVAQRAGSIANTASLIGSPPSSGGWATATLIPDNVVALPTSRPPEGVEVWWPKPAQPPGLVAADCPPSSNATAWFVTIRLSHVVPVFFPGLQYLPGIGTCDSSGCTLSLSATTTFRMEPAPPP